MRKRGFQAPGLGLPSSEEGRQSAVVMKGRGATANPASRFLARHSEAVSDGWAAAPEAEAPETEGPETGAAEESAVEVATELFADATRRIITRNRSPDVPFDRSINPYKGCEHGCIYCFARPTHAYLDLSPGIDFETRIFYKTRVREALAEELGKPGYECRTLAMGTNTDPYQPAERRERVTRAVLEVLLEHRHPVSIVTKGQLILRDLDLLSELARHGLVSVAVSLTTLDRTLKTRLEPRTADPAARLKVVRTLTEAGVPAGVMVAPVIPFLNDAEIEAMVAAAAAAGAVSAHYILLRLPGEVKDLFKAWLAEHYPLKAERIMNAVRASRGGREYDPAWGKRMRGEGPFADLIARRFAGALKKHGLGDERRVALRTDLFRPPGASQMRLF